MPPMNSLRVSAWWFNVTRLHDSVQKIGNIKIPSWLLVQWMLIRATRPRAYKAAKLRKLKLKFEDCVNHN